MSSTNISSTTTMNTASASVKKVAKKVTAASPATTPAPAPAPAPVAAPVAAAEPVKKAVKRVAAAVAAAPVSAPVAVAAAAPVAAATVEAAPVADVTTLAEEITALQTQLTTIRDAAGAALAALKRVTKRAAQEVKEARKSKRRARPELAEGEVRKPSNFEKPVPISDDLSLFLGGGKNNQMSRAQVNSAIHKYINEHSLRVKHDITPDAPLRKLLGVDADVKLTNFNIQKYLVSHYPKPAVAAATKA